MKAKAITKFYDTEAKKIRQPGDIFCVTPARFNEIRTTGNFVEVYNEPGKVAEKAADKK